MNLEKAATKILKSIQNIDKELSITFDAEEITLYWNNLRFDVQSEDINKALKIIKDMVDIGVRFE